MVQKFEVLDKYQSDLKKYWTGAFLKVLKLVFTSYWTSDPPESTYTLEPI